MDLKILGGQVPSGRIRISGAKNSATRLLAGSLLAAEPVRFRNFPTELVDVRRKVEFINLLGGSVDLDPDNDYCEVNVADLRPESVKGLALLVRTTYLLAAGQLARNGIATVPYPGGCQIGNRGYDLHVKVWQALGCEVHERESHIEIKGKLEGGEIAFPIFTVGGTENALLCASVAHGTTFIRNAYIAPEVHDLIEFLRQLGASITVYGNSLIRVDGVGGLLRGASFEVMPDRLEALTWIVYGALSGGELLIENVPFEFLTVPFAHLREAGIDVFHNTRSVYVNPDCVSGAGVQPFEVSCGTYPGVISDMQPFFFLLGLRAQGVSRIHDYRYPERIEYAKYLEAFAPGSLMASPGQIVTHGPAKLIAANVRSTDLRGSMALILAALIADGQSVVRDAEMALRGYNKLGEKLREVGVTLQPVQ